MVRGVAAHVHQADAGARLGDHAGHLGIAPQRGHVVDEPGARARPPPRDRAPWRCRSTSAAAAAIRSSTGSTRRNSSSSATGSAPGRVDSPPTSTSAAPSRDHPLGLSNGRINGEELAAIGERVGSHVEDPHHGRTGEALSRLPSAVCRLPTQMERFGPPSPRISAAYPGRG